MRWRQQKAWGLTGPPEVTCFKKFTGKFWAILGSFYVSEIMDIR